ncbi:MAG: kinase [Caulobacteraceae bacterium]|nr:kinase [Caulobacteraceae bacterium]
MAAEDLPSGFETMVDQVYRPLADEAARRLARVPRPCHIGLCGPQGGGKSTGAAMLRLLLQARGLKVALLSLDDVYLTCAERLRLAETIHPLLAVRGPPGTHDVALLETVLAALDAGRSLALPAFDKARDDRRPKSEWPRFEGPADAVILEGWCLGAQPEPPEALREPLNALERVDDPDGTWRAYVNAALARYQPTFRRLDFLIMLQPPGSEAVAGWRREQEAKLRRRAGSQGPGLKIMSDAEVDRFVQHYERITRSLMRRAPERADALVMLDDARRVLALEIKPPAA